jgi:ATP-dependent Lon protease
VSPSANEVAEFVTVTYFEDIPASACSKLEFIWLERVDDAIAAVLEAKVEAATAAAE